MIKNFYRLLTHLGNLLQSPVLLLLRLYWGWQLFLTGKGKLVNLDTTANFFASLNIPLPKLNAFMAGSVECVGGLLLFIGLGSRLVSIPVAFTMVVAYITADAAALRAFLTDPGQFTGAAPFPFLLVSLLVLAFGPGALSVDALLARQFATDKK
jgi:putative oxidoreductase